MDSFIEKLVSIRPNENQIAWQSLEFTAFFHFGMNTFTNKEWGDGKEAPVTYNPTNIDTDQWCKSVKSAGIKACLITAKHHDGFCLFDTATTNHNVILSQKPLDIVASLAKSCKKYNLKMGVYLSPWDMNAQTYGTGIPYDDFFCAQLEELTTKYGDIYSVWFDGACGEGANGKKQVYDWGRYYAVIRKNQPKAVIAVCGPDVRWIGNEGGHTRPSEWSVVAGKMRRSETTLALSQQADNNTFREKRIASEDEDLGSQEFLLDVVNSGGDLCWYPAEVDVSIRPGWFYHPEEDHKVRSVENLLDIYVKSVGGNAVLLLNIPPDINGQINAADVKILEALGERIRKIFTENLFTDADISIEGENKHELLNDNDHYWMGKTEQIAIDITLPIPKTLTHIVLCEEIRESQRIESFTLSVEMNGLWQEIYRGTTVGYKKICLFAPTVAEKWRINITKSRISPTLRYIGGYVDEVLYA